MRHRPEVTEAEWTLSKVTVLVVVLGTLAGFTVLSHLVSHARAGRIACLENQRATLQALVFYQTDNAGNSPATLDALRSPSRDPSRRLGRCPEDTATKYYLDPASGRALCPNPDHRPGL